MLLQNLKKNLKSFKEWCDITYYKITHLSIKLFWINIKRWFAYYKIIRKTYDFDYSSLLEIEHYQLIKLRDCISKYQNHVNSWRDIRNMNLAISCLEIVLEDGCSYSNGEVGFFKKGPNEKGFYELIPNPKHKYMIPIYVNERNYKRFWKNYPIDKIQLKELYKDYLRIEKAWYLYNKIRKETLRQWWD